MACNIEQANNDIDRLLESSISEDIKKELRTVKEQLAKAKKLKLEEKNTKLKSVQQVLEQYKKDENIEKENAKLLKYIQDNVKFEMNYSKQLAYDFFTGEGVTGNYDWKDNVVTIADFDGLRNDKEMMKMLSIEQVNQDDSVKDIDTASTQINMIISEINKRNIKFTTKLHESVHAAVFNYMRSDKGKAYSEEMTKLYEVVKQAAEANPDMFTTNKSYWAKDVDEFLAEALSKPELIKDLMKIDVEGNLITGAEKSMFDKIIDMIVEALGLSKKEDKLNMHKYLLDSFKAAVEANKSQESEVKLDKNKYENMNISQLRSELYNEKFKDNQYDYLKEEYYELNEKEKLTDSEKLRILELEPIVFNQGIENDVTRYIESKIVEKKKNAEKKYKITEEILNRNIKKAYDNIENYIDNNFKVIDIKILSDKDKIIKEFNKYDRQIRTLGFYNSIEDNIKIVDGSKLTYEDFIYISSKLKSKKEEESVLDNIPNSKSYSKEKIRRTIIHEKIHYITHNFIESNKNKDNEIIKELNRIFDEAKKSDNILVTNSGIYWQTNLHEFIAEGLSNTELINGLLNTKSSKNENLLKRFVVAISNILGIKIESNLFNDLLSVFEDIAKIENDRRNNSLLKKSYNLAVGLFKLDKNKYKTINEEDIMQAKDIMLKNKEECR